MKITVIVPTGEVRIPKKYEYYCSSIGVWEQANHDFKNNGWTWPIAQAHEVEVPENLDELSLSGRIHNSGDWQYISYIPLPRPKKKVKKWQWVLKNIMSTRTQPTYFVSLKHYATSQDAVEDHFNVHAVLRINETEIEVEE